MMTMDEIRAAAHQLTNQEKAQLIQELASDLAQPSITPPTVAPGRPFRGILAQLGTAPSAEEIDEVRREMWANFAEGDDW